MWATATRATIATAVVLISGLGSVWGRDPAARLELVLQPDVRALSLSPDTSLEVRLRVSRVDSLNKHGTPQIHSNLGEFQMTRLAAQPGSIAMSYLVPTIRHPAVAVFVASVMTDEGAAHATARLRLLSEALVEVDAPADSTVTLEFAGNRYGPKRTGRRGRVGFRLGRGTAW